MNLRIIALIVTASALSLLGLVQLTVAQQEEEVPRLTGEKVQLSASAGALGHGVPVLNIHIGSYLTILDLILSIVAIGVICVILHNVLNEDLRQNPIAATNTVRRQTNPRNRDLAMPN